ncbi:MAG: hypothetical protein LBM02_10180 [Lachnospiraceae bacterium]|jgi:hypothetical protein|nr:hypothetical protein [Lachnospiraceae bacterium]
MLDTQFQYYPAKVYVTKPLGIITLRRMLESIRNPKENIKEVLRKIQQATKDGNNELKSKLKSENLFYFTPSVMSDGLGRRYENVMDYNGLMVVEFDKIAFAEELKVALFKEIKSIIAAFISPSGMGCKFIVKIPKPKDKDEYKEYFCGLAYHLDKIEGFDIANYNPLLPLFLSWDPNILIRTDAKTWTGKGEKINAFDLNKPISKELVNQDKSEFEKKYVLKIINKMFDSIYDNAHPQVISKSLIVGGYIASGYITEFDAISLINSKIECNSYMAKDVRGYKRTALEFLKKGQSSPVILHTENKLRIV